MVTTIITGTLQLMSSVGIGTVVGNISRAALPAGTSAVTKACVYVGSVGVGGVITMKVGDYYEDLVEQSAEFVKQFKKTISKEEPKEEVEVEVKIEEIEEEVKPKKSNKSKGKAKAESKDEETEE